MVMWREVVWAVQAAGGTRSAGEIAVTVLAFVVFGFLLILIGVIVVEVPRAREEQAAAPQRREDLRSWAMTQGWHIEVDEAPSRKRRLGTPASSGRLAVRGESHAVVLTT